MLKYIFYKRSGAWAKKYVEMKEINYVNIYLALFTAISQCENYYWSSLSSVDSKSLTT